MDLKKLHYIAERGLYTNRYYSSAKYVAQDALLGRTFYATDENLKFFKAKILGAKVLSEGLFFLLTESSAKDFEGNSRGFRSVLFDVFGTVVYRLSIDEMHNTRKSAEQSFWAWFNHFNEESYYREVLENLARRKENEKAHINELLSSENEEAQK